MGRVRGGGGGRSAGRWTDLHVDLVARLQAPVCGRVAVGAEVVHEASAGVLDHANLEGDRRAGGGAEDERTWETGSGRGGEEVYEGRRTSGAC